MKMAKNFYLLTTRKYAMYCRYDSLLQLHVEQRVNYVDGPRTAKIGQTFRPTKCACVAWVRFLSSYVVKMVQIVYTQLYTVSQNERHPYRQVGVKSLIHDRLLPNVKRSWKRSF